MREEEPYIRLDFTRREFIRAILLHPIDINPMVYRRRTEEEDEKRRENRDSKRTVEAWVPDVWEALWLERIFKPEKNDPGIIGEFPEAVSFSPMWGKRKTEPTMKQALAEMKKGNIVGGFFCAANLIFREHDGKPYEEVIRALISWMEQHFPEAFTVQIDMEECDYTIFLTEVQMFAYWRPEFVAIWKKQMKHIRTLEKKFVSKQVDAISDVLLQATVNGSITWRMAEDFGSFSIYGRWIASSQLPYMSIPGYPTVRSVIFFTGLVDGEEEVEQLILKEGEDEYVFKDYSTVAVFNCTGFYDLFQAIYDKHPELVYREEEEDAAEEPNPSSWAKVSQSQPLP